MVSYSGQRDVVDLDAGGRGVEMRRTEMPGDLRPPSKR
jgi:hypothetical protein